MEAWLEAAEEGEGASIVCKVDDGTCCKEGLVFRWCWRWRGEWVGEGDAEWCPLGMDSV